MRKIIFIVLIVLLSTVSVDRIAQAFSVKTPSPLKNTAVLPATKKILDTVDSSTISRLMISPISSFVKSQIWGEEKTLASSVDFCCAMTVSDTNKIHVAYYDQSGGGLIYLTNASGTWVTTVADSGVSFSAVTAITMAYRNGKTHILYTAQNEIDEERTYTYLKYATNKSGSWVTESIETGDFIDSNNPTEFIDLGITIDSSNFIHIVYEDYFKNMYDERSLLIYQTNKSGTWSDTELEYDSATYYGASIALDSSDKPYIAYYDTTANTVKMTSLTGSTWTEESVAAISLETTTHPLSAIIIDSKNRPHIAYQTDSGISHAKKSSSWKTETAHSDASGNIFSLSLVNNSSNQPGIGYCSSDAKLTALHQTTLIWSLKELATCSGTSGDKAVMSSDGSYYYFAYRHNSELRLLSTYIDTDDDGIQNSSDTDDDNDGIPDTTDAFSTDATESSDSDGDGVGDNVDNCPSVTNPDQSDSDGDGIGNACDEPDPDDLNNASDY